MSQHLLMISSLSAMNRAPKRRDGGKRTTERSLKSKSGWIDSTGRTWTQSLPREPTTDLDPIPSSLLPKGSTLPSIPTTTLMMKEPQPTSSKHEKNSIGEFLPCRCKSMKRESRISSPDLTILISLTMTIRIRRRSQSKSSYVTNWQSRLKRETR